MDFNPDDSYIPDELDSITAARDIKNLYLFGSSPQSDGFTACTCKHRMFLLKCLIEDLYNKMPEFPQQEKEWEQQRLMDLLKK